MNTVLCLRQLCRGASCPGGGGGPVQGPGRQGPPPDVGLRHQLHLALRGPGLGQAAPHEYGFAATSSAARKNNCQTTTAGPNADMLRQTNKSYSHCHPPSGWGRTPLTLVDMVFSGTWCFASQKTLPAIEIVSQVGEVLPGQARPPCAAHLGFAVQPSSMGRRFPAGGKRGYWLSSQDKFRLPSNHRALSPPRLLTPPALSSVLVQPVVGEGKLRFSCGAA